MRHEKHRSMKVPFTLTGFHLAARAFYDAGMTVAAGMVAASKGPPTQNPAFNLPDYGLIRLAGGTLSEAHLEHPE
jgi:hypothetical protein